MTPFKRFTAFPFFLPIFQGNFSSGIMQIIWKIVSHGFWPFEKYLLTGNSYSDALILASTNPQYDKRLFMFNMKTTSAEH